MKKLLDNKKYILIGIVGIIVIIFLFILLLSSFKNKDDIVNINKSVNINVGGYNQKVLVKSLIKNFVLDDNKYKGRYTKIYVEINNLKDVDSITSLHEFKIVDKDNQILAYCYHDGILPDNKIDDILPNKIEKNSKTSGYLYCPVELTNNNKLKITVIAGGKMNNDKTISYKYEDYYIDLN